MSWGEKGTAWGTNEPHRGSEEGVQTALHGKIRETVILPSEKVQVALTQKKGHPLRKDECTDILGGSCTQERAHIHNIARTEELSSPGGTPRVLSLRVQNHTLPWEGIKSNFKAKRNLGFPHPASPQNPKDY